MQLDCAPFINCAADTITTSTTSMPPAAADHHGGRGPLLSPASYPLLDRDDNQEDNGTDERPESADVDRSRRRRAPPGRSESSSSKSPFVPACYTWPPPQQRQDSKSKLAAKLHASTDSDEGDYVLYTDDDDDVVNENEVHEDRGSAAADVDVSAPTPATTAAAPVTPTPSSSDAAFGCYSPPGEDEADESSVTAQVAVTGKNVPREQEPGFTDHSFAPPPPPPSNTEDREESALALARKAAVGAVGGSLVGVGAVMIPLPIPMGVVVVAAGMAVLGTEFPQAKQVLVGARDNLATAVAPSPSEVNGGDPEQKRAMEEEEADLARAGRAAATDLAAAGEVDTDTDGEDVSPMPSPCGCGEAEPEEEEENGSEVGKGEGLRSGQQRPEKKPSFHGSTTSATSSAAPSLSRRGGYDDMCEDYSGIEKGVETAAREAKFALKRFGRKVLPLLDKLVQEPQPESTTTATATAAAAVGTKEATSTEQDGRRGNEASHLEMGRNEEEDLARLQLDDKGSFKGKRNSIEIGPSPTLATCVSASSQDDGSSTSLICQRVTDDEDDR